MPRKRNALGQYIANDYRLSISLPGPFQIIKYLLLALLLSPWVFIFFYKFDLLHWFQSVMEMAFLINKEEFKKSNGFF